LDRILTNNIGEGCLAKEDLDTFSVYSFSIGYPRLCRLEFNPKSRWESGDVVFHFPDHEKVFLSWGKLEAARKKFATVEEQAMQSLIALGKSRQVRGFETITADSFKINTHRAAYNRVKVEKIPSTLFPGKATTEHQALSLHLHCESSSRYFVVYAVLSPKAPEDLAELFLAMVRSFRCH
jgi:hypothetical protein